MEDVREFTAHLLAFTSQDLDQLGAGAIDGAQTLSEHLVGWEGIQDAGGQPLAFSPETMALALDDIDVRRGLMEAQVETASGGAERKNSKPLPVH